MSRCLPPASIALCMILVTACSLPYVRLVHLNAGDGRWVSDSDIEEAVAVVAEVVRDFGFEANPRVEFLKRDSATSDLWEYRLVADYTRSYPDPPRSNIIVSVGVHKETGQLAVMITDLPLGLEEEFTASLEQSLVKALGERLPSHTVRVERRRRVALFGP
jgi:hypothetical protein